MSGHRLLRRSALVVAVVLVALVPTAPPVVAAPAGESVLLVHNLNASQRSDVASRLQAAGFTVSAFPAGTGTPTAAQLAAHDAVLVTAGKDFHDAVLLGHRLADYVDAGGHVVLTAFSLSCPSQTDPNAHPRGRFRSQGYAPVVGVPGCEQLVLGESTLTKVQAHHPLLAGVERFDGGLSSPRQEVVLSGTSLLVGRWDDGLPLVARNRTRRAIGGVVALNMVPYSTTAFVGSWDAATSDGVALMVSALLDARPVPVGPAGFPDVAPAAFYAGSVDWAGSAGVTTGYGTTGEFRPEVPVDRGQMAAFLHRTMDRLVGSPPSGFPDVPPGAFYRAAVDWAKASGVTTGFGTTGRYAPDEILTRGQMVTFLHRVAGTPGPHGPHGFPDVAPSAYYEPAVRWARATGVTTGYGTTGEFRPDEPVTRGQMVTFLNRLVSTPSAWHVTTQIPTTARF